MEMILNILTILLIVVLVFKKCTDFMDEPHFAELYCGNTGCGKTSMIAFLSTKFRHHNWFCYSNVAVKGCALIDANDLEHFKPIPHSVIFIDEIGIVFNSRSFKEFGKKKGLIEFFKKCRHYKCRIIAFSQTWDDSDKIIRELFQKIHIQKRFLRLWSYSRPVIKKMDIYNTSTNDNNNKKNNGGQIADFFKYRGLPKFIFLPRWYNYIDSYEVEEERKEIEYTYIPTSEDLKANERAIIYYPTKILAFIKSLPKRIKTALLSKYEDVKYKILCYKHRRR